MRTIKIDIIGGGLSGLSAAAAIKKHDNTIDVIVHEKHKTVGDNVDGRRCGEAHTIENEWNRWLPLEKNVFNTILTAKVTIGKKTYTFHRKPGTAFILNRPSFIHQLAETAEEHGAIIQINDKITTTKTLDGDYIIDASGCPSIVKRELNIKPGLTGISYQQTLEDANCFLRDTIQVIYSGKLGYYWIFPRTPKKHEVNVGVGFIGRLDLNLRKLLEKFKEQYHIEGKINHVTGGLIPVGLQYPLRRKNILFVGDAGVGTFPLTGQGIYRALISGDVAARCLVERKPGMYSHLMMKKFIKWDVIGKIFLYSNCVFRQVNPGLVLLSLNWLFSFTEFLCW